MTANIARGGFEGMLDGTGVYLLSSGYIVEAATDEAMRFDVRYARWHYTEGKMRLVLLAHEDCNFRCVYCSQAFTGGLMQPEVREAVRALVVKRQRGLERLAIDWFGGEPLLGLEAIADLAPDLQAIAAANGTEYTAGMTTNGYLLTTETAERLLNWGILGYQVTLDGGAEDHDRSRPLRGGGPSFAQVFENVTALRQFPHQFTVRLRINYDRDNVRRVQPLFDLLYPRIGGDPRYRIGLNPVRRWGGKNDATLPVIDDQRIEWDHTLAQQAVARGLNVENPAQRLRSGASGLCFASLLWGFVIGADGRVMKCTNFDAMPRDLTVVGRLLQNGALEMSAEKQLRWIQPYYHYDPKCKTCFYLPACHGGLVCPASRARGLAPPCPPEKTHIRTVLLNYWQRNRSTGTVRRMRTDAAEGG